MDELATFNRERWNALVAAGVQYSQPWLDLTPELARIRLDKRGWLGDVAHQDVLCLATGGGQQSAAFAMLGAKTNVIDLSDAQLAQDRVAATQRTVPIPNARFSARRERTGKAVQWRTRTGCIS